MSIGKLISVLKVKIIFFNINSIFTKIRRKIPTGSDIYIQASFIDFCSPPIKSRGTFKDDELKSNQSLCVANLIENQLIEWLEIIQVKK